MGSYFKYRAEGSQIFWILFWGATSSMMPFEVSSDVHFLVCRGECTHIFY